MYQHVVIFGGSGAIGSAFVAALSEAYPDAIIEVISRSPAKKYLSNIIWHQVNDYNELAMASVVDQLSDLPVDLCLITLGILHQDDVKPEKSLKDLSEYQLSTVFRANVIAPAIIFKHMVPLMQKKSRSILACLSARVGSISDNQLGGWYAYRASKAALNMLVKNASIEVSRFFRYPIVVGLHPGTVISFLSNPFSSGVSKNKLFSPEQSVAYLLSVLSNLDTKESGRCFAFDGREILP